MSSLKYNIGLDHTATCISSLFLPDSTQIPHHFVMQNNLILPQLITHNLHVQTQHGDKCPCFSDLCCLEGKHVLHETGPGDSTPLYIILSRIYMKLSPRSLSMDKIFSCSWGKKSIFVL